MTMRRVSGLALMIALAACSSEPAPGDPITVDEAIATPTPRTTDKSAPLYQQAYAFEGSWAADPAACAGRAWQFERSRIRTDLEQSCDIVERLNETGSGITLRTACTGSGAPAEQRFELMTIEEGSMTVQRYVGDQMQGPQLKLVRCS